MSDVLIVSVPYQNTFGPSLAPALLKACLERDNISATAWDLVAEFNYTYNKHQYYESVIAWFQSPELQLTQEEFDWYSGIVVEYASKIVNVYKPKFLGVSIMFMVGQRFVEDLCYHVKRLSDIHIIIGGGGCNTFAFQFKKNWYELLLDSGLVDTVVIGEGEYAFSHVVTTRLTGVYQEKQLSNAQLTNLPIPNYKDYDLSVYLKETFSYVSYFHHNQLGNFNYTPWTITASKGCVRSCTFCDVGKIWPKYRCRPGAEVAAEMIDLHQRYSASYFTFTDSLINGGLKPLFDMNQVLADTIPKTIKYESQAIFRSEQDMPEKYFKVMARAGCYHVNIGLESGSERVRNHMGKRVSDADLEYSAQMFLDHGILQTWNIVVGYPTETEEDFQLTLDLVHHWFKRANGKIQFVPVDAFMMLDGVPITSTDLYTQLDIQQEIVNGYSDFAWTTGVNPGNTYDVRAQRFISLCELLKNKNSNKSHVVSHLDQKIKRTLRKVNWYNEHKSKKKVFSVNQI